MTLQWILTLIMTKYSARKHFSVITFINGTSTLEVFETYSRSLGI
jgi:hypothetical protein